MTEADVRLVHITKRFGNNPPAVDDISVEVPPGSFTTLLGPSGCGKTTLLRMIAGFYEPDAGDIFLAGRRVNDVPAHRRGTGMVFQDYALFPHMTVEENVGYGLKLAKVKADEVRKRVADTLGFLGLTGLERRAPGQLSGGQQQRVALARALVMSPRVLLLDEPLSNLDAKLRVGIRAELIAVQRELKLTTIYVTHDQDEALAMSDWIAVLDRGRLVQWGTPWEVYYRPETAFVADFVGTVNLVPAEVVEASDGTVRVRLDGATLDVPLPGGSVPPSGGVALCIRPESMRLGAPDEGQSPGGLTLRGRVERRTFLGHLMRYGVQVGEREWIVDDPDPGRTQPWDGDVTLQIDPRRVHILRD